MYHVHDLCRSFNLVIFHIVKSKIMIIFLRNSIKSLLFHNNDKTQFLTFNWDLCNKFVTNNQCFSLKFSFSSKIPYKNKKQKIKNTFYCFLLYAVPPNIEDSLTSTDIVAREGSNVTLKCRASGSPAPLIKWKR